jgi:hypothetical protein
MRNLSAAERTILEKTLMRLNQLADGGRELLEKVSG